MAHPGEGLGLLLMIAGKRAPAGGSGLIMSSSMAGPVFSRKSTSSRRREQEGEEMLGGRVQYEGDESGEAVGLALNKEPSISEYLF